MLPTRLTTAATPDADPFSDADPVPDADPLSDADHSDPTRNALILRSPLRSDGAAMWSLAQGAVDTNSAYSYLMLCEYFADTCVVAEIDGVVVGFVTGFRPPDTPTTVFVWQIVVGSAARGMGLGSRMLDRLALDPTGIERYGQIDTLKATVTPHNTASQELFRAFARRRSTPCRESPLFAAADFPADAGHHEPEIQFQIGPWQLSHSPIQPPIGRMR